MVTTNRCRSSDTAAWTPSRLRHGPFGTALEIDIDLRAQHDIAALPAAALQALAEAMTVLELAPWNGRPINPDNPDGAVRTLASGSAGMLTYLVLDDEQRVDVLIVAWVS